MFRTQSESSCSMCYRLSAGSAVSQTGQRAEHEAVDDPQCVSLKSQRVTQLNGAVSLAFCLACVPLLSDVSGLILYSRRQSAIEYSPSNVSTSKGTWSKARGHGR